MTRWFILAIIVILMLSPATLLAQRHGGGHGGRGPGGGMRGGWNPADIQRWRDMWNKMREEQQKHDEQQRIEETKKKVEKAMADGWKALKAHDTAAAMDAFYDVLELKPESGEAKLGVALARAQKGSYSLAQTDLEAAGRAKADARLVSFNMAVSYARLNQKPRAMVMMNKLIVESKGVDEMLVNAQRVLLASMDDKLRASVAALPGMIKILEGANHSLATARAPLERWGVAWMPAEAVKQQRESGATEPLPAQAPFLMPGELPLPEKGKKLAVNPLKPVIMGSEGLAMNTEERTPVAPKPVDAPVAVATGPKMTAGPFVLGGGGGGSAPVTPVKPVEIAVPPAPENAPAPVADPIRSVASGSQNRSVRGAAFAVAPDMVMTCQRLVSGATAIQVQTVDGKGYDATVISADEASGVALLRVEGAKFSPVALAESAKSATVNIAAFVRPAVFSPNLDIVKGELYYGASGKLILRAGTHPRSAGSPVMDDQGKVLGMLVATRDDLVGQLPVIPADVLRKFAGGKFTGIAETSATDPSQCVVEMMVTRND